MDDFLKHLISYEIQTSTTCPHRLLFDKDYIENFTKKPAFEYANIYFFCRTKKVRFDIDKTELLNKRTLKTELIIEGKHRKEVIASLFDLSQTFRTIYGTKENFEDMVSDDDPFWDCEYLKSESEGTTLVFNQVATHLNTKFDFILTPENIEFDLDIDLDNPPEIVYVGQSFRILDRVQTHKTLNKAVSQLKDGQDLRLYFTTFKFAYGGHRDFADLEGNVSQMWMSEHGKTKEFKSKIDLVERFLIHFLRPEYNEQHVNSDIKKDSRVKELLLENEVSSVWINFGMHGNGFQFWSPNQSLKSDFVGFDFEIQNPQYYDVLTK